MANKGDIYKVALPNGDEYNFKDKYVRENYRALNNNDFDTINVTELNSGNLINTGAARFLNTINGSISGNAATATKATQDSDGSVINTTYAKKSGTTFTGRVVYNNISMPLSAGKVTSLAAGTTEIFKDGIAISNPATFYDVGWIRVTGTGESDTVLEIATGDDGGMSNCEKTVVRQYNTSNAVAREAVLLNTDGTSSFPVSVTSPKFIGALQGNADTATKTTLLKPIASTTSTATSNWNIPSGSLQVWGQQFSDSTLKYTPSGGSATTITDTGDWTIWLTPSATANVATLNMRIDGSYYGSFVGNLSGNATSSNTSTTSTYLSVPRVAKDSKVFPGINKVVVEEYTNGASYSLPSNAWYHIYSSQGSDKNYGCQLALGMTTLGAYYRKMDSNTWSDWQSLINTDTNYYHTTGSWSGLTYTATANGGAGALAFTIPTGTTATTVAVGNHTHSYLKAEGVTTQFQFINSSDVTTWTQDALAATNSIAYMQNAPSGAPISNHGVWLNVKAMGTPFQLYIPDHNQRYIYKRYWVSANSAYSDWFKLSAGHADSAGTADTATSATKATQDSDGNAINTTYLKKSGGTLTGGVTFLGNQSSAWNDKGIIFSGGSRIGESSALGIYGNGEVYIRPNSGSAVGTDGIVINASGLEPTNNNTENLGSTTNKWNTVYATTFSGNATTSTKATKANLTTTQYGIAFYSATDGTFGNNPCLITTSTGGLEVKGIIAGDTGATGHGLYGGGGYHNAYNNIILHGDASTGSSGIAFVSDKINASTGAVTNVNQPSDRAFIQYHACGITTATTEGNNPTLATSGESGKFVIGIGNDADDQIWLQTPSRTGLIHQVATGSYVIPDTGNTTGNVGSGTQPVYVSGGVITATTYSLGKSVPSDAKFTDQNVNQSATTTANWRKIVLSYQDSASAGTAVTANTNVVYVTPNAEIQPSTGTIRSAGHMIATLFGVNSTNGTGGGISLYGGAGYEVKYGVAFRTTANQGKHGYVQSDWATYFTMDGADTRGWVFKNAASGKGNVASISSAGNMVLNGSLTVGGNTANTSGVRQVYNATTQSLDFVFVA